MMVMPTSRRFDSNDVSSSPVTAVWAPPPHPLPRCLLYTMFWYRCSILESKGGDETAYRGNELAVVAPTAHRGSSAVAMQGRHPALGKRLVGRQPSAVVATHLSSDTLPRSSLGCTYMRGLRRSCGTCQSRVRQHTEGPTKLESLGDMLRSKLTAGAPHCRRPLHHRPHQRLSQGRRLLTRWL